MPATPRSLSPSELRVQVDDVREEPGAEFPLNPADAAAYIDNQVGAGIEVTGLGGKEDCSAGHICRPAEQRGGGDSSDGESPGKLC